MINNLVSIIIPVYNAEKYIEETIKTIKAQSYKNWEVIFVDDASNDYSREIICKHLSTNIKLIILEKIRNSHNKIGMSLEQYLEYIKTTNYMIGCRTEEDFLKYMIVLKANQ